ncbi:MAG: hypothetical protein WD904_05915 [Dehalococcoidia bacterium]
MKEVSTDDLIQVLGCDIDRRPDAPGIAELSPFVLGSERRDGALRVRFAPEARETLAAFVEAERLCCADVGWQIAEGPDVVLTIAASEAAVDMMQRIFIETIR